MLNRSMKKQMKEKKKLDKQRKRLEKRVEQLQLEEEKRLNKQKVKQNKSELKNMKKSDKKNRKAVNNKWVFVAVIIIVAVLALLGGGLGYSYEKSVLDIYADQQDSYVQLVLDQINLQPERSDEEIVSEILGTLDSSNNKYWTLSKEQTMVFVKDVMETNRYKGFTLPMIFESKTATEFINNLELNKVLHKTIEMDGDTYVASGVIFRYNGFEYKICLLTNETVILDNNSFLSSRIELWIYVVLLLIILMTGGMVLISIIHKHKKKINNLQTKTERLNSEIQTMEEKIEFMDSYNTRWNIYSKEMIEVFVKKLSDRTIYPIAVWEISFDNFQQRNEFLSKSVLLLDKKVIRFYTNENKVMLIFVQYKKEEAERAMFQLGNSLFRCERTMFYDRRSFWDVYNDFLKKTDGHSAEKR